MDQLASWAGWAASARLARRAMALGIDCNGEAGAELGGQTGGLGDASGGLAAQLGQPGGRAGGNAQVTRPGDQGGLTAWRLDSDSGLTRSTHL